MWLPIAIIVLAVLLLLMSWAAFRMVMKRPKSPDLSAEEDLMTSEFFAYAAVLKPSVDWFKSRKWQSVEIAAADGVSLKGIWLPVKKAEGAILLLHGYGASPMHMAPVARWAEKRKLSVLAVSQRAHGESGGTYTSLGLLEASDTHMWLEKLRELCGESCPLILYGSGMGGAAVLYSLGESLPDNVIAAVSESGYPCAKALMKHIIKHEYHMRAFPTLQLLCLFGRMNWHGRAAGSDACENLKTSKLPLLLSYGKADTRIQPEMTKAAYEASPAPQKKLVECEKAGHGACTLSEPEKYFGELDAFLLPLMKKWNFVQNL